MSDECVNPGTMCASVISCGSHGISRLHVWVERIVVPSGNVMVMGLIAFFLLVTGAFSTRKCPVAPESETACFTARVVLCVSKIVAAFDNSCNFLT